MKSDVYYGTVLKTCRDFVIILVNNFIDRVTVTGNFLFGCCSYTLLHCPVNTDCNINWLSGNKKNCQNKCKCCIHCQHPFCIGRKRASIERMHILFNSSRSCFLLLMASSVNTGLLIVTPISKQPSDVLTFGNNVSIIASSTMNFVMQCLVPPGDVNQLTINAGYRESNHNTVFGFNCSACA
ncbi:hypothetical protein AC73_5191 [Escherichia coli 2-427-07_S4_C1]|nr:hypothetical protein EC32608_2391 [Escherichia coli 3.2608]KDY38421.1 hypothetical protein AC73_5191 [Escherichia coli 2-427-07_S4_C1]